jgi:hypothetical protein
MHNPFIQSDFSVNVVQYLVQYLPKFSVSQAISEIVEVQLPWPDTKATPVMRTTMIAKDCLDIFIIVILSLFAVVVVVVVTVAGCGR